MQKRDADSTSPAVRSNAKLPKRGWQMVCSRLVVALVVATFFPLLWLESMRLYMSHDEEQFIVPGLLMVEKGLLPYKDYAYFHAPYLAFVQGVIAQWNSNDLKAARTVGAVTNWGVLLVLTLITGHLLRHWNPWLRSIFQVLLVFAIAASKLMLISTRIAWNHGGPTAFGLLGFYFLLLAVEHRRRTWCVLLAGFAIAIAIGMRISFVPLLAPYGLGVIALTEKSVSGRLKNAAKFAAGVLIGLSPFLLLVAQAPEQAYFGNFKYPKLSRVWRTFPFWEAKTHEVATVQEGLLDQKHPTFRGRPLGRKLAAFAERTLRPHVVYFALVTLVGIPLCGWRLWKDPRGRFAAGLILLTIPFVWWGCIAPSRFNQQYYCPFLPYLFLTFPVGLARFSKRTAGAAGFIGITAVGCLAAPFASLPTSDRDEDKTTAGKDSGFIIGDFLPKSEWGVSYFQTEGAALYSQSVKGKVLTPFPLIAIQAGYDIYPEFSSGEFAIRSAHLIPASRRNKLKLVSPWELSSWLEKDPPGAVLVRRSENGVNTLLREYSTEHQYKLETSFAGYELWTRPD